MSKKIQNSSGNRDAFKDKCTELKFELLNLIKVIVTRWNSHALCLLRLLEMQPVIDALCNDRKLKLRNYEVSDSEWNLIEQLAEVLEVSLLYVQPVFYSNHCDSRHLLQLRKRYKKRRSLLYTKLSPSSIQSRTFLADALTTRIYISPSVMLQTPLSPF